MNDFIAFFKLGADRIPVNAQNTSGIAYICPVMYHFSDLFFDKRITGLMSIGLYKRSASGVTSVALSASASSTISFDVLGLAIILARNRF
ncbi:MAG: hypothetical protein JWP57_2392 [Spirosoma sp.]|nr:hypothetical protein [Spirosoma sp.]